MNAGVKVSVIMPSYNGEPDICECLDSVLGQDLCEIEVICCDDGSTDGTKDIVRSRSARDPRVRLIELNHAGSGPARNAGIEAAVGKYIAFLDCDDKYPDLTTLRTLYEAAESSGCPIAGGNTQMFSADPTAQVITYGPSVDGLSGVVRFFDYQTPYGFYSYIYDREFLLANKLRFPPFLRFQDPGFFVRAMLAAGTFFALDRVTYLYRVAHKTVDWAADDYKRMRAHFRGLDDLLDLAAANGLPRLSEWVVRDLSTMLGDAAAVRALEVEIRGLLRKLKGSGFVRRKQWKEVLRGFASHERDDLRKRLRREFFGRLFLLKIKLMKWK